MREIKGYFRRINLWMKKNSKNFWLYGIIAFSLLFIATAILFRIFEIEILPSQFYGALIGVVITAIITVFLLQGQTANEAQRDKDVRIFEEKIKVYSEFTEKMWAMLDDDEVTEEELKMLRNICFSKLVFYLNNKQIEDIYEQIKSIDFENADTAMRAIGEITKILKSGVNKSGVNSDDDIQSSSLLKLFNTFEKKKFTEIEEVENIAENTVQQETSNVRYWHFNLLHEKQQIEAFKNGNWVLALIEYGQDWRTNLIKQVKPNDVIFLFKRGGSGYIGAFRALDPTFKILEAGNDYSKDETTKYDIYNGLDDGASLCSNILVEPIAYNFKGVGYKSVRRRTIERMNDMESVKFLLNKFNGNDLNDNQILGKDKLGNEIPVKLNNDFFREIIKKNNLQ